MNKPVVKINRIYTDKAPATLGPYSQAIEVDGVIYISGQIAIEPNSGKILALDIEGQAEQCCKNIEAILHSCYMGIKSVVKTTCYLVDMADFQKFNAVYEQHFVSKPARSCVAVRSLPAGALCEIDAIAVK